MNKKISGFVLTAGLLFTPHAAFAANIFLNGSESLVPKACNSLCPCGVGAALQFVQNVMNAMISFAVVAMIFFIVWAGFLFVTSVANPESRSQARSMLINAFIGMFIVLAAWLIVDYVMKTLYDPSASKFGPWNQILQINDPDGQCIVPKNPQGIAGLPGVVGAIANTGIVGSPTANSGGAGGTAVSSLSAQEAAKKLLASSNISKFKYSTSCGTNASAIANLEQVATGQGMVRCSCGGGGSVAPSDTLLNSLVDMANAGASLTLTVIAGGCHTGGASDNHYLGKAVDIARNSTLDAFFSKYPTVSCQRSKTGYRFSGEVVCFEAGNHYHVSPTGN